MNNIVSHLTSVHNRDDVRIYHKECKSLALFYKVYLVVADGKGASNDGEVEIYDVGRPKNRAIRSTITQIKMYFSAKKTKASLYHLHDPELLVLGVLLKLSGKKVVFDFHENVSKQIQSRKYNKFFKWILLYLYQFIEYVSIKFFIDGLICATPSISQSFANFKNEKTTICNYPIIEELYLENSEKISDKCVCFIGNYAPIRGLEQIVTAIGLTETNATLVLGGKFSSDKFRQKVEALEGWGRVADKGWQNRRGVKEIYESSIAGLVTLHPIPNFKEALPVKMFEYMCAGLPVIASNFPYWKEIVIGNDCGICVDPLDPKEIASAIDYFVNNPEVAIRMGINGQKAVLEKYNWGSEAKKLISFYSEVLG